MKIEYAVQIVWSPEDDAYIGMAAELPGCFADGRTPEEAMANVRVVIQEWLEVAAEEGREIPPPLTTEDFERLQQEAQANLRNQVEQEVKKIVEQILGQLLRPPAINSWQMRSQYGFGGLATERASELVPSGFRK